MDKQFEHLKKIPLSCAYMDHKQTLLDMFDDYIDDCDCNEAINHVIFNILDDEMNENGMDKAVNNIISVLYLMEHDVLDDVICYDAYCDILDIETGEYNDLFNNNDLDLLMEDISKIKTYFSKHPELIKE